MKQLLLPQRDDRVHLHRAAGRDKRGHDRDRREDSRHQRERPQGIRLAAAGIVAGLAAAYGLTRLLTGRNES